MKFYRSLSMALVLVFGLSSCAAVSTAVKKRNLEVKTQMSDTIWLDPVSLDKKTVYLQIKNTTDKPIVLAESLNTKLTEKGYRVIQDPAQANYWIQANVLKLEKMDLREAQGFLSGGYGAGIMGGAAGALIMAHHSSSSNAVAGAGLIGAVVGMAADALVEDISYSMITDVRLVEKSSNEIKHTSTASLSNGNSGQSDTLVVTTDNKQRYQTRVLSTANKVNLDLEEATPALIDGLVNSISGIL